MESQTAAGAPHGQRNFGEDVAFLKRHVETIVLRNHEGAAIAVVPAWQGRTMTSTANGDGGVSYGWINDELISSGRHDPQANLYGGEDRFWISPEGSQFSFFFEPQAEMKLHNWRCPPLIDNHPFDVRSLADNQITVGQSGELRNYQGVPFKMELERTVTLMNRDHCSDCLGIRVPDEIKVVGHESRNRLANRGQEAWNPARGLPAVWILCMNKPSPRATIVIPFRKGPASELGTIVTSDYFGHLDDSRLQIDENRGIIFFLGDGKFRSKLGISYPRACPTMGSWDDVNGTLTIVQFNLPSSAPVGYTTNLWEVVEQPFAGDAINSYNDGINESGGMLGPFYELETLSPALALGPGDQYEHIHRTFHFEGPLDQVDLLCRSLLDVSIDEINSRFHSSRQ